MCTHTHTNTHTQAKSDKLAHNIELKQSNHRMRQMGVRDWWKFNPRNKHIHLKEHTCILMYTQTYTQNKIREFNSIAMTSAIEIRAHS